MSATDLFADPVTRGRIEDAYVPRNLVLGVAVPALLTAVPLGLHLTGVAAAMHGGWGMALPWALVLLHVPVLVLARAALLREDAARFQRVYAAQSLVQIMWLFVTCWYAQPFFLVVGCLVYVSWIFNDASVFHGAKQSALPYGVAFPAFLLVLLGLDLIGLDGLIALGRRDSEALAGLVVIGCSAGCLAAFVLMHLGSEMRRRDGRWIEAERAAREREVIDATGGIIDAGLGATKFSHDLAGPLTAQRLLTDDLRQVLDEVLESARPESAAEIRAVLEDLRSSIHRASTMVSELAEQVRLPRSPVPADVRGVVDEAVSRARAGLEEEGYVLGAVRVEVQACRVRFVPGVTSSLANLIGNAAVHQPPGEVIDLIGTRGGDGMYTLSVRDRGTEGETRRRALERIQRRLLLEPRALLEARPEGSHRGQGLALTLARVLAVRIGGELSAEAAEGRGIALRLRLPIDQETERPTPIEDPDATPLPTTTRRPHADHGESPRAEERLPAPHQERPRAELLDVRPGGGG